GIAVKGTIHWVNAADAVDAEIRLYERLFLTEDMNAAEGEFKDHINPDSLVVITGAKLEASLERSTTGAAYQFLRKGYFCLDKEATSEKLVFNRTVTLKDAWGKEAKKG
ncbi:MAG: glutamine--tRNA ligase, partial [Ferruginibacter sp.]